MRRLARRLLRQKKDCWSVAARAKGVWRARLAPPVGGNFLKALVSGVLLLMFVVTATCAQEVDEQPNRAEFDNGPLRNPRRQLSKDEGSGPSSDPAEFDGGPLRNPRRQLPEEGGGPTGVGEDGRNVEKEKRLPKVNEAEMPSLDKEPFIIIKERGTCSVLPVFDVTRDKLRFQVGRISYASREGAESDARRLCGNARD